MHIPVGYAQINWRFVGLGAPRGAQVTLGVENQSNFDADEMAESAFLSFSGNLLAFLSDQVNLVECLTKMGPNATGPQGSFVGDSIGGDAGDSGSPAVAYLVKKNTPYGGRTGRGRWFLPGAAESRVEPDGSVQSTQVEGLTDALGVFLEEMQTQELLPVVLHSQDLGSDVGPRTITSFTVDGKVATQRRRLR
jgi:hypothetical protein